MKSSRTGERHAQVLCHAGTVPSGRALLSRHYAQRHTRERAHALNNSCSDPSHTTSPATAKGSAMRLLYDQRPATYTVLFIRAQTTLLIAQHTATDHMQTRLQALLSAPDLIHMRSRLISTRMLSLATVLGRCTCPRELSFHALRTETS